MYNIKLPQFEGAFDLLLFFIERDELDIYDIPIAKVTNDFLEYIRIMEAMNIDLASEFILTAATLMRIKSKFLLPRKPLDEAGNEIDPRLELAERLLEYKRYKSVLEALSDLETERLQRAARGSAHTDLKNIAATALVDAELESLSLFKLLQTFQRVLKRYDDENLVLKHQVLRYTYSIKGQKRYLVELVQQQATVHFQDIFEGSSSVIHAIFTFLALLDLLQLQVLDIVVGEGINNFWISQKDSEAGATVVAALYDSDDEELE